MPSEKQIALADLIHWSSCLSRGPMSHGPLRRLFSKKRYERVLAELNLIHRIPHSILEPGYTDNDISFINDGIRHYLEATENKIDSRTAYNFIQLIDYVPDDRRKELSWTAPQWLRELAKSA